MRYSELAFRYATALFDLGVTAKMTDKYLESLRAVRQALAANQTVEKFISSPLVRAADKTRALKQALENSSIPKDVLNFLFLLSKKDRLVLLDEIIAAYQAKEDDARGVTRGIVRSPKDLSPAQQESLTKTISDRVKKKVILQFTQDRSLIGGLVAQVGSLTFDDTLATHLRRIKEDLTRRIN